VETDWLQSNLGDPNLRVLDCTVYLPNYCDASAAQKLEIVSGRAHYEQGHIPGSAIADLLQDLSGPADTRFRFPMPPAAQFSAAMSRYGVGEGVRVVLSDDMPNTHAPGQTT
jgi:thiosulfate/3-mercaptopyruvate sulfurtransferase